MRFRRKNLGPFKSLRDLADAVEEQIHDALPSGWKVRRLEEDRCPKFSWIVELPWDGKGGEATYGVYLAASGSEIVFAYGQEVHMFHPFMVQPALIVTAGMGTAHLSELLRACFEDPDRYPPNRLHTT